MRTRLRDPASCFLLASDGSMPVAMASFQPQRGDDGTGGPRSGGCPGGGLDLGDDLVLTDGHRIQPARDREQVLGGRAADPDGGQAQDLACPDRPARGHEVRDGPDHLSDRA